MNFYLFILLVVAAFCAAVLFITQARGPAPEPKEEQAEVGTVRFGKHAFLQVVQTPNGEAVCAVLIGPRGNALDCSFNP